MLILSWRSRPLVLSYTAWLVRQVGMDAYSKNSRSLTFRSFNTHALTHPPSTGVTIASGGVPTAGVAAGVSSAAAVYSKMEFTPPAEQQKNLVQMSPTPKQTLASTSSFDEDAASISMSPSGLTSLRRWTISESPTPELLTPVGANSFSSVGSADFSPIDPDFPALDVRSLIRRLQVAPLTGQVVAWAWDRAAQLSLTKRAPPVSLLAALWPATDSCAGRCTAQDVVEIVDSWLVLLQRWPRHFLLAPEIVAILTTVTIPAAIKRMSDSRLGQLAQACCGIARHRTDPSLSLHLRRRQPVASARDLMQPIFALIIAETAWRVSDPIRYVSPELMKLLMTCGSAWRWTPVVGHDPSSLVAIKESTRAAMTVVRDALERIDTSK